MSFCDRKDILNLIEDLLKYCWPEESNPICTPFPTLTYNEAMNTYGTDKPDLRFGWKVIFDNVYCQSLFGNPLLSVFVEYFLRQHDFYILFNQLKSFKKCLWHWEYVIQFKKVLYVVSLILINT